jgi:hypothetical protein
VAVDPVVTESVACSCVAESVEATCACGAVFDSNKAPNNLLANEPSLSAQGTGGSCGSRDPVVSTLASGIMLPGNWARKTLFIPPSSPLPGRAVAIGVLAKPTA